VGDPDALFDDPSSWKAEFLIGALITDMEVSLCYEYIGKAKGEMYMKVDWQVYSRLDRKVVYKTTTEGSFKIDESRAEAYMDLFVNAFGAATQNLLADQKFYALLSTETKTDSAKTKFERVFIVNKAPFNSQIESTINDVKMSVVTVFAGDVHGSGFFIDSRGYVLTSAHVVGGAKFVKIKLATGRELLGEVLRKNSRTDIALVMVDEENMVTLPINEKELNIGATVCAIGSPIDQNYSSTLTKGVLSAYRSVEGMTIIQSDVNILPGNSGGPLTDQNGNAVGICSRGIAFGIAGLNFFIPINNALSALNINMVSTMAEAREAAKREKETWQASVEDDKKSAIEREVSYWDTIKDSEDISKFEDYLTKYPDGTFAELARSKIDELSHLKLAVFPWYVKIGAVSKYVDDEDAKERAIDALKQALSSNDIFVPTHSNYKLGKEYKTKLISLNMLPGGDINELWRKKSSSSRRSPNIDLVCKLGKQLKVDIVLLYSIRGTWRFSANIYFVNVNTRKVFTRSNELYHYTYEDEIIKFTKKSFMEFEKQLPIQKKGKRAKAETKQVAFNPKEPWTGKWRITGGEHGVMHLNLKQTGETVKYIKGSSHNLRGKVEGNRLKGWYDELQTVVRVDLTISQDKMSFKGKEVIFKRTSKLTGEREG
jgi:hypothetical protein